MDTEKLALCVAKPRGMADGARTCDNALGDETFYNEFNRTDNEFNLKISILNLFFNSFQYDETSFYKVDDNYKLLLNDIVFIKAVNANNDDFCYFYS